MSVPYFVSPLDRGGFEGDELPFPQSRLSSERQLTKERTKKLDGEEIDFEKDVYLDAKGNPEATSPQTAAKSVGRSSGINRYSIRTKFMRIGNFFLEPNRTAMIFVVVT